MKSALKSVRGGHKVTKTPSFLYFLLFPFNFLLFFMSWCLSGKKFCVLLCLFAATNALVLSEVEGFAYCGGTGEPNAPYQICDVNSLLQLAGDANDYNKCFIMTADINLAGYEFNYPIIAYPYPFTFSGIFNGNEHNIYNLTMNIDGVYFGLFGSVGYGGVIKNLGLENVKVTGYGMGGALVSGAGTSTIINCYSTVDINLSIPDKFIGGLIGECSGSKIINCYSEGKMDVRSTTGTESTGIGGLVGVIIVNGALMEHCYSTVDITVNSEWYSAGGLVGWCLPGAFGESLITKCFSTGTVINIGGLFSGGLIGLGGSYCEIEQCFSEVNVTGPEAGGLVGYAYGNINNCYATGNVSGCIVGGLIGSSNSDIFNSYSTGIVDGNGDYVGGLVGLGLGDPSKIHSSYFLVTSGPNNGLGTPLDGNEMRHCINFSNWDFIYSDCNNGPEYIWFIFFNSTYPQLAWNYLGLCTAPDVVGMETYDANNVIIVNGFTVGNISYEYSEIVDEGYVISQDPQAGPTDCGSAVNYVVSKGNWPCTIPDIVGMTMSDANSSIIGNNFTLGNISYNYSDDVNEGYVISQNPGPGPSECDLPINYTASLGTLPDNGKFPDYYDDDIVNFVDFSIFADAWLKDNSAIDLTGDNYVNIVDMKVFCNHWLKEETP
jgi:hypothetical protein